MSMYEEEAKRALREFASSKYAVFEHREDLKNFSYGEYREHLSVSKLQRFWDRLFALVSMKGEVWSFDGYGWTLEYDEFPAPTAPGDHAKASLVGTGVWHESDFEKYLLIGGHSYVNGKGFYLVRDVDGNWSIVWSTEFATATDLQRWGNAIYMTGGNAIWKTIDDPAPDFDFEGKVADATAAWGLARGGINGNLWAGATEDVGGTNSVVYEWDGTSLTTHNFAADIGAARTAVPLPIVDPDYVYVALISREGELWRYDGTTWERIVSLPGTKEDVDDLVTSAEGKGTYDIAPFLHGEHGGANPTYRWVMSYANNLYEIQTPGVVKKILDSPGQINSVETWLGSLFYGLSDASDAPSWRAGQSRQPVIRLPPSRTNDLLRKPPIGYSLKLWDGESISANDTTKPVPTSGYDEREVYFISDTAGTLTIEADLDGEGLQTFDTISVSADLPRVLDDRP